MELILGFLIVFLLSFGLPFVWFIYFTSKDRHPEPFVWLSIAFILGIIAGFFSYFTQNLFSRLEISEKLFYFLSAFSEEFYKFLFVFLIIFPKKVFDEPIDGMIYMITAAFGFSFLENIFYLGYILFYSFYLQNLDDPFLILIVSFFRFLGANLLHILSSALIGYGYSMTLRLRRVFPFLVSFISAWMLHFIFNFIIIFTSTNIESKNCYFCFNMLLFIPLLWFSFLVVVMELKKLVSLNNE